MMVGKVRRRSTDAHPSRSRFWRRNPSRLMLSTMNHLSWRSRSRMPCSHSVLRSCSRSLSRSPSSVSARIRNDEITARSSRRSYSFLRET